MNPTVDGQQWLVLINQDERRTLSTQEVKAAVQAGTLSRETLVWRSGMAAWVAIGSLAELATPNSRPTVPRARTAVGWDTPLGQTPQPDHAHADSRSDDPRHYDPRHYDSRGYDSRSSDPRSFNSHSHARPQPGSHILLELFATGAAVALIVLITSYALYSAGAFQPGSASHDVASAPAAAGNAGAEARAAH